MLEKLDDNAYKKRQVDYTDMDDEIKSVQGQWLKVIKLHFFVAFYHINSAQIIMGLHYHLFLLFIEICQLCSYVLVDSRYCELGPFEDNIPWDQDQIIGVVDLAWVFRFDRYLKQTRFGVISLVVITQVIVFGTTFLGIILACRVLKPRYQYYNVMILNALIYMQLSVFFIPIVDTFIFITRCSFDNSAAECSVVDSGYHYAFISIAALLYFLLQIGLIQMVYFIPCHKCGGSTAIPHPRYEMFRLSSKVIIIVLFYFAIGNGRQIIFLLLCFVIGFANCFVLIRYMPYYNRYVMIFKQVGMVTFTSALFCLLVDEFFQAIKQKNSSITILFFFLTPCLWILNHLQLRRFGKKILKKDIKDLTNFFQIEIKIRLMINQIDKARAKHKRAIYGDERGELEEGKVLSKAQILRKIEKIFEKGHQKFAKDEYVYIWPTFLSLHYQQMYIQPLVRCFKALSLSNKLDTQFILFYLRKMTDIKYKKNMHGDAYKYDQFQKYQFLSNELEGCTLRLQLEFWNECMTKAPSVKLLDKLCVDIRKSVDEANECYETLLKIYPENIQSLSYYSGFLKRFNCTIDYSESLLQKASNLEESQKKLCLTQDEKRMELSYFDDNAAIIHVLGDQENIGDIIKVNASAVHIFDYTFNEFVNNMSINILVPQPFAENHMGYMKAFHTKTQYTIIDQKELTVYLKHKKRYIMPVRLIIRGVPQPNQSPNFLVLIKPLLHEGEELILCKEDFSVIEVSANLMGLITFAENSLKIQTVIRNFDSIFESMQEKFVEGEIGLDDTSLYGAMKLEKFGIGRQWAWLLHFKPDFCPVDCSESAAPGEQSDNAGEQRPSLIGQVAGTALVGKALATLQQEGSEEAKQSTNNSGKGDFSSSENLDSDPDNDSEEEQDPEESHDAQPYGKQISSISKEVVAPETPALASDDLNSSSQALMDDDHSQKRKDYNMNQIVEVPQEENALSGLSESSQSIEEDDIVSNKQSLGSEPDIESSKSSNRSSSATSELQFNHAVKRLVKVQSKKVWHYVRVFQWTLILTIIILTITSALIIESVTSAMWFYKDLSHNVNLVGDLRYYAQSTAYYARMVTLMDADVISKQERDNFVEWIGIDADEMHCIIKDLYLSKDKLKSDDLHEFIQSTVHIWNNFGGTIVELHLNLYDAISAMLMQGFLLEAEQSVQKTPLALNDRRAFYLATNGNGETLVYLNDSTTAFINAANEKMSDVQVETIIVISCSCLILAICALLAIVPLIMLEKMRSRVWAIFFKVQVAIIKIIAQENQERLGLIQGDQQNFENEEAEQRNDEKMKGDDSSFTDLDKTKYHDIEIKDFRSESENARIITYDSRKRKIMVFKLSLFFVLGIIYFYLIYYTGYHSLEEILNELPVQVNWTNRRKQLVKGVNQWIGESLFYHLPPYSYKSITYLDQQIGNPLLYTEKLINELEFVENSVVYGNEEEGLSFNKYRTATHEDLIFKNACLSEKIRSRVDCEQISNEIMTQGLHSAMIDFIAQARELLSQITDLVKTNPSLSEVTQFYNNEQMQLLRDLENYYLFDPLLESSELIENDYIDAVEGMRFYHDLLISLFVVCSVLLFFLLYNPMIQKLGQETTAAWDMTKMIPQEQYDNFQQLVKVIKGNLEQIRVQ